MVSERRDEPLFKLVETLLTDEQTSVADLRMALTALSQRCFEQQRLLDRLTRLSDGFQRAERERGDDYLKHYQREVRRVEKIVRISDRYQDMLREMNNRLISMANTDYLTAIANRRYACEELNQRLNQARRHAGRLCVALVDIDSFKQINDGFGHQVGDEVIRAVADTFSKGVGDLGLCARWGGEEFLIILPDANAEAALPLLDCLRQQIECLSVMVETQRLLTTVSIGLVETTGNEAAHELIRRADAALYMAKGEGRNQVCLAT